MARALPSGAQAGAGGEEEEGGDAASVGGPVPAGANGAAVQTGADVQCSFRCRRVFVVQLVGPSVAVVAGGIVNPCGSLSQLSLGAET